MKRATSSTPYSVAHLPRALRELLRSGCRRPGSGRRASSRRARTARGTTPSFSQRGLPEALDPGRSRLAEERSPPRPSRGPRRSGRARSARGPVPGRRGAPSGRQPTLDDQDLGVLVLPEVDEAARRRRRPRARASPPGSARPPSGTGRPRTTGRVVMSSTIVYFGTLRSSSRRNARRLRVRAPPVAAEVAAAVDLLLVDPVQLAVQDVPAAVGGQAPLGAAGRRPRRRGRGRARRRPSVPSGLKPASSSVPPPFVSRAALCAPRS